MKDLKKLEKMLDNIIHSIEADPDPKDESALQCKIKRMLVDHYR